MVPEARGSVLCACHHPSPRSHRCVAGGLRIKMYMSPARLLTFYSNSIPFVLLTDVSTRTLTKEYVFY